MAESRVRYTNAGRGGVPSKRCWDGAARASVDAIENCERAWREVAQDRGGWAAVESHFVAKVLVQPRRGENLLTGYHRIAEPLEPRQSRRNQRRNSPEAALKR